MAANDQKSGFTLKDVAGQLPEVSSMTAHVPAQPAVTSPGYGTEKHLCFMHTPALKHAQRGKKNPLGIKYRNHTKNLVLW